MACQRFRSDRERNSRESAQRGAVNVCDRSGRSPVGRAGFAGWKRRGPSRWKDAGEAEWWRHGRCGQVARKDAAGRSPVHPLAPSRPLATGCPPRRRSCMHRYSHIRQCAHTRAHKHRESLFLSFELLSLVRSLSPPSLLLMSRCFTPPPFPLPPASPL